MGMFDNITCEYPLPIDYPNEYLERDKLQTKDLDCELSRFIITAEGMLKKKEFCPNCCEISQTQENCHFTGWINFYHYVYVKDGIGIVDINDKTKTHCIKFFFNAEFFRGKLKDIVDKSYIEEYNEDRNENGGYYSTEIYVPVMEFINNNI